MAEVHNEKPSHNSAVVDDKETNVHDVGSLEPTGDIDLPPGWKYYTRVIAGKRFPWYASPKTQLGMVAFVCFLCPGMFNALGGLGGGGKTDTTTADNMVSAFGIFKWNRWQTLTNLAAQNIALYSTFAVFGFFGGTIINRLGVKLTLSFGGLGYCLYAIALLVSVHSAKVGAFNVVAGAILGVCAALLWTAQGTIMLSYPNEGSKGRYFAWFWAIFNLGGVIGSLVCRKPFIERQSGS